MSEVHNSKFSGSLDDICPATQFNFHRFLEAAGLQNMFVRNGKKLSNSEILNEIKQNFNGVSDEEIQKGSNSEPCFQDVEYLHELLKSGEFDVNEININGETALMSAVASNHVCVVELLLRHGADPNLRGKKEDLSPLMEASIAGYTDVARLLLQYGASVIQVSSNDNTALHFAAIAGNLDIVKLLLEYGTPTEVQNDTCHTPLMEATSNGHIAVARCLIEHGANINSHSNEFKESALTLASYKGHTEMVKFLLEAGADHEHRTDEMHTALMEAAMEGHVEVAKLLLNHGASVSIPPDSFESPLTLASCGGHTELALMLIGHEADIEEVNDESYTPLMEAAREGHEDTVALLISCGADVNAKTEETQETALTLAACGGFIEVCELLLNAGADLEVGGIECSTPLMEAAQEGHLELVKRLLECGANVNAQTANGDTALHYAAEHGHLKVCEELILWGPSCVLTMSEGGKTPLMKAARNGHLEIVRLLVNFGSPIDQMTTNNDANALSLACNGGHASVVHFLLKSGSDPHIQLHDGSTMLIEAVKSGNPVVLSLILDYPMSLKIKQDKLLHVAEGSENIITDNTNENNTALSTSQSLGDNPGIDSKIVSLNAEPLLERSEKTLSELQLSALENSAKNSVFDDLELPKQIESASSNGTQDSFNVALVNAFAAGWVSAKVAHEQTLSNQILYPQLTQNSENSKNSDLFDTNDENLNSFIDNLCPESRDDLKQYVHLFRELVPNADEEEILKKFKSDFLCLYEIMSAPVPFFDNSDQSKIAKTTESSSNLIASSKTSKSSSDLKSSMPQVTSNTDSASSSSLFSDITVASETTDGPSQAPSNNSTKGSKISASSLARFNAVAMEIANQSVYSNLYEISRNTENVDDLVKDIFDLALKSKASDKNMLKVCKKLLKDNFPISNPSSPIKDLLEDTRNASEEKISASSTSLNDEESTNSNSSPPPSLCLHHHQINNNLKTSKLSKSDLYKCQCLLKYKNILDNRNSNPKIKSEHLENFMKGFEFARQQMSSNSGNGGGNRNSQSLLSAVGLTKTTQSNQTQPTTTTTTIDVPPPPPPPPPPPSSSSNLSLSCSSSNHHHSHDKKPSKSEEESQQPTTIFSSSSISVDDEKACQQQQNLDSLVVVPNNNNNSHHEVYSHHALDINACIDSSLESALSLACSGGHKELVKLLLDRGADKEHREKKSYTPLHSAVYANQKAIVSLLLDYGANIEAQVERTKDTALSIACSHGKYEIVEELLKRGANKEHRNMSDYTPLSLAASSGFLEIIELLLHYGSDINSRTGSKLGISPLMLASMNGHKVAVHLLLDYGADINAYIETNKNTALTLACFQGRHEVVQILVDSKANIEHRAKTGLTPLMEAASGDFVEVGKILIANKADVNALPVLSSRDTALTIAADKGNSKFVNLLLENGAIVDAKNKKGATPLWLACNSGHMDVVHVLIASNADVNCQDNRGVSCLMAAFRKGFINVVRLLVQFVTQFPSDKECSRHIKTIVNDNDLVKRCQQCKDIIVNAKEKQESEARKNANHLLEQIEAEEERKANKQASAAKKREKKKMKKKRAKEKEKTQNPEHSTASNNNNNIDKDYDSNDENSVEDSTEYNVNQNLKSCVPEIMRNSKNESKPELDENRSHLASLLTNNNSKTTKNASVEVTKKESSKLKTSKNSKKDPSKSNSTSTTNTTVNTSNRNVKPVVIDNPSQEDEDQGFNSFYDLAVASDENEEEPDWNALIERHTQNPQNNVEREEDWKVVVTKKTVPIANANGNSSNPTSSAQSANHNNTETNSNNDAQNVENWKVSSNLGSVKENIPALVAPVLVAANKKRIQIHVSRHDIGKVIGQGGSVVSALRTMSGVQIDIESSKGEDISERMVYLKGQSDLIMNLHEIIQALIQGTITGNDILVRFLVYKKSGKTGPIPNFSLASLVVKNAVVTTNPSSTINVPSKPINSSAISGGAKKTLTAVTTKPSLTTTNPIKNANTNNGSGSATFAANPSVKFANVAAGISTNSSNKKIPANSIAPKIIPALSNPSQPTTKKSSPINGIIGSTNGSRVPTKVPTDKLTPLQLDIEDSISYVNEKQKLSAHNATPFGISPYIKPKSPSEKDDLPSGTNGSMISPITPSNSINKSFARAPGSERSMKNHGSTVISSSSGPGLSTSTNFMQTNIASKSLFNHLAFEDSPLCNDNQDFITPLKDSLATPNKRNSNLISGDLMLDSSQSNGWNSVRKNIMTNGGVSDPFLGLNFPTNDLHLGMSGLDPPGIDQSYLNYPNPMCNGAGGVLQNPSNDFGIFSSNPSTTVRTSNYPSAVRSNGVGSLVESFTHASFHHPHHSRATGQGTASLQMTSNQASHQIVNTQLPPPNLMQQSIPPHPGFQTPNMFNPSGSIVANGGGQKIPPPPHLLGQATPSSVQCLPTFPTSSNNFSSDYPGSPAMIPQCIPSRQLPTQTPGQNMNPLMTNQNGNSSIVAPIGAERRRNMQSTF